MKEYLKKTFIKMLYGARDVNYVSGLDQMIVEFDKIHPKRSSSQKTEIKKHRSIYDR